MACQESSSQPPIQAFEGRLRLETSPRYKLTNPRVKKCNYFATDAECRPITPMTISPSDTILIAVAGSLK